ncbi:ornithine cyclodeaminase family protein [Companilactobacillus baiquanensis]|uniref:Ornithine cyclodeaminase family protein n=1 Tax=Companilactobacillus baiquanensis TaxID=2486005 RepID=A0ABW1UXF0_9LACO|nr:ornithine cyclodeaminase family protein [Companilactobacillus baiquanensis]
MRYLSAKDIKQVLSMKEAITEDKKALQLYSNGKADIPLRTNLSVDGFGQSLYMPGTTSGDDPTLGLKIVAVYPDNPKSGLPSVPATMITQDAKTGIVNAILDGTYLTQLRTGAVQGAATDLLAKEDAKTALLIGTGGQALTQLEAMLTVRKLELVYIFDRDQKRAKDFCQKAEIEFKDRFSADFVDIDDPNKVVSKVDIITSVTTAKEATFDGDLVQPGTHINGIGAYTPEMCEIPVSALKKADKIIFDTLDGVLSEAGDIIQPLEKSLIKKSDIDGELGQLVNKDIKGRKSDSDITIFKTVGTAVLDIIVADKIVKKAILQNIGTILN